MYSIFLQPEGVKTELPVETHDLDPKGKVRVRFETEIAANVSA